MQLRFYPWAFVILFGLLLVGPNALAQEVSTTFDRSFDFSEHNRYAWRENRLMTRQHPDDLAMVNKKIIGTVNHKLAAKGFIEDKGKPDFYVSYEGGTLAEMAGGAPGPDITRAGDPLVTPGEGRTPGSAPSVWFSMNGRIAFHINDAKSNKPIWGVIGKKKFRDPDKARRNQDKEIEVMVNKLFKDFPPRPR